MFDQTFVQDAQQAKGPFAFAVSIVLQACALGLLILIPLIYTQALPSAQLRSLLTAPAPPTAPAKPHVSMKAQRTTTALVRQFKMFFAPVQIPSQINTHVDDLQAAPAPSLSIVGVSSEVTGSAIPGIGSLPGAPPPITLLKPKVLNAPVRVATGVAEANLIRKVMPIYPPLARSVRVQGTVEFTAIISKEGMIENLQLVRGHPLLVEAAKEAVLQWRYRPTLLNGQPVEVVTDILVNFTLSQ